MVKSRFLQILGLVLAGLCLIRVFSVAAAMRDVESYPAIEKGSADSSSDEANDDAASSDSSPQAEIRLASPAQAAADVTEEGGADLVPGVERMRDRENAENAIIVPTRMGRKIASEPATAAPMEPASPVAVRPEAFASSEPTQGKLSSAPLDAGVMEPGGSRSFTNADAQARRAEVRPENIVAGNTPASPTAMGLRNEPGPETRFQQPLPEGTAASRTGVQEVSLIVSDYGYFPSRIFVTQGVPVKIFLTTPSKVTMCFMADNFGVQKGVSPGRIEEVHFMPQEPGNYRFYCPVRSIEGTITVREPPDSGGRSVASVPSPPADAGGHYNEPKRAGQLRALIED